MSLFWSHFGRRLKLISRADYCVTCNTPSLASADLLDARTKDKLTKPNQNTKIHQLLTNSIIWRRMRTVIFQINAKRGANKCAWSANYKVQSRQMANGINLQKKTKRETSVFELQARTTFLYRHFGRNKWMMNGLTRTCMAFASRLLFWIQIRGGQIMHKRDCK